MIDNIFGDLMDDDVRTARAVADRAGVRHRARTVPAVPAPGHPLMLALTTSGPLPFDAAVCWFTAEAGDGSTTEGRIDFVPDEVCWDDAAWDYLRYWSAELPPQPAGALVRYKVAARAGGSQTWTYADNQAGSAADATEFSLSFDGTGVPAWAREAVVYHIFVDRFYPGDGKPWLPAEDLGGFFGGTLRGVIQKLHYVESLGFNTIWLSPVFASPSHHGYDAVDYYRVEPRLGTNADLTELIEAAHGRGIRVILDFVANHWSRLNATFQEALADEHSPYHDWYTWRHWPDDYERYFDVPDLPQLNLKRGGARDYLLDCARYWLEQGVDGFRLDFAYGPPLDFWTDFRRACRSMKPDCWLFGEVVHTPEVQATFAGRLDGTLDFLLARGLRDTFGRDLWPIDRFEAFLAAHEAFFPEGFVRPGFLDNHDMNRFLYLAGDRPEKLKLAALALFTLAGSPIVYYGTEAGVTQTRPIHEHGIGLFEMARMPMKWGPEQDRDLVAFFRRLIALRRGHPVLPVAKRRLLHLDAAAGTYAYLAGDPRSERFGAGDVIAAFNLSAERRSIYLGVPGAAAVSDLLNGHDVVTEPDGLGVRLAPWGGAFIA
ncbi:MAG TPA: alpha-amylase family glycosyl hydrolase [Anaerolineae bacterium]